MYVVICFSAADFAGRTNSGHHLRDLLCKRNMVRGRLHKIIFFSANSKNTQSAICSHSLDEGSCQLLLVLKRGTPTAGCYLISRLRDALSPLSKRVYLRICPYNI
jgi:hypothetical protein